MKRLFTVIFALVSVLPAFSADGTDCHTREEFMCWSREFRAGLKESLGLTELEDRYRSHMPEATVREVTEDSLCRVDRLMLKTAPDDSLPVDVFVPGHLDGRVPLVIVLEDREGIAQQAVREGYIAVSVPARGLRETVWNVSRTIDYAFNEYPVDKINVICIGSQHAGVATVYAGALDTRISICIPVSSFCPSRQSGGIMDMVKVAALTAPRLFHVIHGEDDVEFPADEVRKGIKELQGFYAVAGNSDGCRMFTGKGGRRFYGEGVWRFVRWRLLSEKGSEPSMPYAIINRKVPFVFDLEDFGQDVDVSPHALGAKVRYRKGNTSVKISRKGHYVIKGADGKKMFLFVEDRMPVPQGVNVLDCKGIVPDGKTNITAALQAAVNDNAGRTLVFPEGVYLTSGLQIPSDSDIFLEEGAVIRADRDSVIYEIDGTRAFVEIRDACNVGIRGAGVIDGDGAAVKRGARNRRNILVVNSSDVTLEGVISMNPASWNTHILGCRNVTLRGYKVLNDLLVWNTDGIDPDCSENVLIENCFAHCGDDCIAIKTTDRLGQARDLKGVTVRGCVFMSNKAGMKIGTETCGASMSDIVFEDNDVIESLKPVYLRVEDGTQLHDVVYRNNRFERCWSGPSAYDLYETPGFSQEAAPYQIVIRKRRKDSKLGAIYNVLIEDCVYEEPFPVDPVVKNPCKARLEFEVKQ